MWRRPLRLAECKALHLLAGLGAEQQDLRRQDPLVTNTPLWQPSFCAPAACCRKCWTDRHGAGCLLQAALSAYWQGQGGAPPRAKNPLSFSTPAGFKKENLPPPVHCTKKPNPPPGWKKIAPGP